MKLLALDTTTEACSVAVAIGDAILTRCELAPRRHTQLVFRFLDELLNEAGIKLPQFDAIAFTRGPGSFTGVRIGASIVQGLAFAVELPVIAVSSLQVLAQGTYRQFQATQVLSALDARMQEVYWGQFALQNQLMQAVGVEAVSAPEKMTTITLPEFCGAGSGWQSYPEVLQAQFATQLKAVYPALYPEAQDIIPLAQQLYQQGELLTAIEALPIYLRDKVVEHG